MQTLLETISLSANLYLLSSEQASRIESYNADSIRNYQLVCKSLFTF